MTFELVKNDFHSSVVRKREHTTSIADGMTMLISAPKRCHGCAAILARNQQITAFSRQCPVFLRNLWIGQRGRRYFGLCTRGTIPGVHGNSSSRCCLVDTVVVSRASITSFSTTGPIAASTTGARSLGTMIASSTYSGSRICLGAWRGVLVFLRTGLALIALGWSSNIPCLEIQTTSIAYHRTSWRSSP